MKPYSAIAALKRKGDMKVEIDGVLYIPISDVLPDEVCKAIKAVDGQLWTEAHYDSYNEHTRKFALHLEESLKPAADWVKAR